MITGLTASTFDLLHAGHIAMLREAKSQCDYLICALQIDPSLDRPEKNSPVQSIVKDIRNCLQSNTWTRYWCTSTKAGVGHHTDVSNKP